MAALPLGGHPAPATDAEPGPAAFREPCVLLKVGEIVLKGGNRHHFERMLQENIRRAVRDLGFGVRLHENLVRSWKLAFQDQGEQAFPGQGCLSPFEEEVRRLRAENKRLLAERDILKKAAAFFAREVI